MLFDLAGLGVNFDKPLTAKILSDPDHKITKHLLYIYSMDCFVFQTLNLANQYGDDTKVNNMGAYAVGIYQAVIHT